MINNKAKEMLYKHRIYNPSERLLNIANQFEARIYGKKGAQEKRDRFYSHISVVPECTRAPSKEQRRHMWIRSSVCKMCANVNALNVDEHGKGYRQSDTFTVEVLDFISPWEGSARSPYFDMGGEGLAVISLNRSREYSRAYTSHFGMGHASTRYLVGKNEAGTYFSHSIGKQCTTLKKALDWIWQGHAGNIIQRQGDIALINGSGPKIPSNLPRGHVVGDTSITHATHPDLPFPGKGQRIIVGRRSAEYVGRNARD